MHSAVTAGATVVMAVLAVQAFAISQSLADLEARRDSLALAATGLEIMDLETGWWGIGVENTGLRDVGVREVAVRLTDSIRNVTSHTVSLEGGPTEERGTTIRGGGWTLVQFASDLPVGDPRWFEVEVVVQPVIGEAARCFVDGDRLQVLRAGNLVRCRAANLS